MLSSNRPGLENATGAKAPPVSQYVHTPEAIELEYRCLAKLSHSVSRILVQRGVLSDILERCLWAIVEALQAVALVRIWTLNHESNFLELQAIAGCVSHDNDLPHQIPLGISIIGLIAQNQQAYLSNDISNDICLSAKDWQQQEQIVSFAGYPLVVEDRSVGVMAIFSRAPFSEAVSTSLEWIANSVALVVDRASAREELIDRRESLLFRLASHIRNTLDLDKILQATVQEVRDLLKIDSCQFLWCWLNPDPYDQQGSLQPLLSITHEAKRADMTSLLGQYDSEQTLSLATRIINLQTVQIEDITRSGDEESEMQSLMADWGMVSILMVPLETRSHHLGAIVCGHSQNSRGWNSNEVDLLKAVADQLVIAMDQAEMYAQTRAAALAAQTQTQQLSEALKNLRQTQAQLIQSEKMSSLGQLVAGIAHEINNPVTFVTGNLNHADDYIQDLLGLIKLYQEHYPEPVEPIQQRIDDIDLDFLIKDISELLRSMKIGTERIRQIVLSLRNFSRLDEAEVKAVDLHEGIDSTLLILQHRLKPHHNHSGIEVVKHYGELPRVKCYASQLNQVFMNILSNAIDAMASSAPPHLLTISTEVKSVELQNLESGSSHSQSWAVVRIADNGTGMPQEVIEKIFDPFFTTKPIGQGTGLGLSISHQIVVKKHRGRLSCQSQPGSGTEFTIEIPIKLDSTPLEPTPPAQSVG